MPPQMTHHIRRGCAGMVEEAQQDLDDQRIADLRLTPSGWHRKGGALATSGKLYPAHRRIRMS